MTSLAGLSSFPRHGDDLVVAQAESGAPQLHKVVAACGCFFQGGAVGVFVDVRAGVG